MRKIIYKAGIILGISVLVSISYNAFSNKGIPLFPSPTSNSMIIVPISLSEAKLMYLSKKAIFVDARTKKDYANGHIKGAINLPYDNFETEVSHFIEPKEREIIVYCGSEDCNAGLMVAEDLIERGYTNVRVFEDGWAGWKE